MSWYQPCGTSDSCRNQNRPELQPIATVKPATAEQDGRYSGGSQRTFSESLVIQMPLGLMP